MCDKTYQYIASLHNHMAWHAADDKNLPIHCDLCPHGPNDHPRKNYATERSLNQHKRRYHLLRAFGCAGCKRRFATADQCKAHEDTHHQGYIPRE